MNFREFLRDRNVILDGAMGTLLQEGGLPAGELPERMCLTSPDTVTRIHRAYYEAGANVVSTNTFGANLLKMEEEELSRVISAAVLCARRASEGLGGHRFVALDVGPCGKLLRPYGDLDFEDAVSLFKKTVALGVSAGVDLILLETFNDMYETKAALLAVKETTDLPVIVTNAYGADGKLMTGATADAMAFLLEGMGADAIGANCSQGPRELMGVLDTLLSVSSLPVVMKPNAGLPRLEGLKTVFDVTPSDFAECLAEMAKRGARVLGGCCGTTPAHIAETVKALGDRKPVPVTKKSLTAVTSYTHAVTFGDVPLLIGERINPTGKKRLKEALRARDTDHILDEGLRQCARGAHMLDVNVGLPDIDEREMLTHAVTSLQAVLDAPLQIDTSDYGAMESALRRYNGKALVNSVSGKEESMRAVFPLVRKYGGVCIALTLDESGIPETAEGRLAIAERILARAESYGIDKKDIVFDTLALTVSADGRAASVTLDALALIRERLGCHTSLGVSNVSFGLPARDTVNAAFFTLAMARGLSAAIMNPDSDAMMGAYRAYLALSGKDTHCEGYVAFAAALPQVTPQTAVQSTPKAETADRTDTLASAIEKGLSARAASMTGQLLCERDGLSIVESDIIPALDRVGRGYEEKTVYLPQLLMSAEAAQASFAVIREAMKKKGSASAGGMKIVLATVKGDIHDIGKNIVRLLLENYGFDVLDLGKDVAPETVLSAVKESGAKIAALSALMTTTVPAMAETVRLIHEEAPFCRVIVGGAVLTESYANKIGADHYAPDAMGAVRYAERVKAEL